MGGFDDPDMFWAAPVLDYDLDFMDGLLNISRHVARSPNREIDAVFARATITAEEDGPRQLAFGYSDAVNLFLNGDELDRAQAMGQAVCDGDDVEILAAIAGG